jgi:hypothetical protein
MIPGPNWARRYGSNARRLCARPGCGSPAAATLRFQPTNREAWLVDLDDSAARTEGDLCARHAGALVLPRGWELHDQRTRVETAPAPIAPAPEKKGSTRGASIARARKRRTQRDDPQLPDLVAVPEPVVEVEVVEVVEVVETVETIDVVETVEPEPEPEASRPALDPEFSEPAKEELSEHLDAQTPLLRRAFQNVWPFEEED